MDQRARTPIWGIYTERQRWLFLLVLFLVSTSNFFDRHIVAVLIGPIKHEFHVTDAMLGVLSGFSFAIFYAIFGIPVARWADWGNRRIIISIALTVWSVMTVLCALAPTFGLLALARVGVGAGESGALPAAQSLIVDYFPPERHAMALSIFTAAGAAGSLLAFGVGGYIAATHGWRVALLLAGAPGLLLALIVLCTLEEPRSHPAMSCRVRPSESLRQTLAVLWRKRSFRCALIGCLLYFFLQYGALVFIPAFLERVLRIPLTVVSVTYAGTIAAASLLGTLGGGWLADRLSRVDKRWLAWLPAAACAMAGPIFMLAFSVDHLMSFMALAFFAYLLIIAGSPPVFAAIHAVCGVRRRAVAIGLVLFSSTLFGGGAGPVAAGALSDLLSATYGVNGLRYSLMSMMPLLIASGVFFCAFGRRMPGDIEE